MSKHVEAGSQEEGWFVVAGPHKHWATYDEHLEGVRFYRLGAAVSKTPFDELAAEKAVAELEALAFSYGYGTADSHLANLARDNGDDGHSQAAREHGEAYLEDPTEGDYFVGVRNSERFLFSYATTRQAVDFLGYAAHPASWDGAFGTVHDRMERAFHEGVACRRGTQPDAEALATSSAP